MAEGERRAAFKEIAVEREKPMSNQFLTNYTEQTFLEKIKDSLL